MSTRVLKLPHEISVTVAQPYAEGHVLSALEADKLNHVFADNIRTSLIAKIKRVAEDKSVDVSALSDEFQGFADAYTFTVRAPRTAVDPVTKEAHKIAKEQVLAAIRRKGGNPADYTAEQLSEYIAKVIQHKPEIMEEAERRVNSSRQIAGDLLSDLFDGE